MTTSPDTIESLIAEIGLLRTLPELLTHHLEKRGDLPAYRQHDGAQWRTWSFAQTAEEVLAWRRSLAALGLQRGERCAMLLPNGVHAVFFDQAVLANALVPVPLHAVDTPGSCAYILNDSGARFFVTSRLARWKAVEAADHLPALRWAVVTQEEFEPFTSEEGVRVMCLRDFLALGEKQEELPAGPEPQDLAALVYTSGTTGRPKGVMLTHRNVLSNIGGILTCIWPRPDDLWFSFLPLSHTFERTTTYYLALGMGNCVAFSRSLGTIQEDLKTLRPTVLMSVPRIYERIYTKIQDGLAKKSGAAQRWVEAGLEASWRRFCRANQLPCSPSAVSFLDPLLAAAFDRSVGEKVRAIFGGRPHLFISGSAPLNPAVAKFFLACGLPILQGYGLTEASPVVSVNRDGANHPQTVGVPLRNLEVRIGENDELQVRGPSVMQGYWKRPADTEASFTEDGWLRTGDQADIYDDGYIRIKGRIKEILVTSTGEKIPPADVEQAIETDPLFDQVLVVGEGKPYAAALAVVNPDRLAQITRSMHPSPDPADPATLSLPEVRAEAMRRIREATRSFPAHCVPRNVRLITEPWTIDNGLLTPTLKIRRGPIRARYQNEIAALYGENPA